MSGYGYRLERSPKMRDRGLCVATAMAFLLMSGCTAKWLSEPSPATANLVNDLKLEGFECRAGLASIKCRQREALIEKSGKVCSASGGCVAQPCHDVRTLYEITQRANGIPGIVQSTERTTTRKIPNNEFYSKERVADLKEFCALP